MNIKFDPNESAQVTVLSSAGAETGRPCPARVLAISKKRMTLSSPLIATRGSAVKVDCIRYIFMGEAIDVQNGTLLLHIHHALKREDVDLLQSHWK